TAHPTNTSATMTARRRKGPISITKKKNRKPLDHLTTTCVHESGGPPGPISITKKKNRKPLDHLTTTCPRKRGASTVCRAREQKRGVERSQTVAKRRASRSHSRRRRRKCIRISSHLVSLSADGSRLGRVSAAAFGSPRAATASSMP